MSLSHPRSLAVFQYSGGVAVPHPPGDEHRKETRLLQTGTQQNHLGAAQEIHVPPPGGVRGLRLRLVSGEQRGARRGCSEHPSGGERGGAERHPSITKGICMRDAGGLSGRKWTCFLLRLPQVGSGERSEAELTHAASIQRWGERDGDARPAAGAGRQGRQAGYDLGSGSSSARLGLELGLREDFCPAEREKQQQQKISL